MKQSSPKDYLKNLFWIEDEIKAYELEYNRIFSQTLKATKANEINVQSSNLRTVEDTYIKLADYSSRIAKKSDDLIKLKVKISEQIDNLDTLDYDKVDLGVCRQLLRYRYTIGMGWNEVAKHLHVDVRQAHRKHGQALVYFAEANPDWDK